MALLDSVLDAAVAAVIPFMPDLATIQTPTRGQDASGGQTQSFATTGSGIPCVYEALSTPRVEQIGSSVRVTASHRIYMPATAITEAISSKDQIIIAAHGTTPALTFRNPSMQGGSDPMVTVVALLAV